MKLWLSILRILLTALTVGVVFLPSAALASLPTPIAGNTGGRSNYAE